MAQARAPGGRGMTDLDKLDAAEERWLRVRYEEAGRIEPTPENALAILRGELIPYDPDLIIEHEPSDD